MGVSSTSFSFGNTAWKAKSSFGRKPLFATPDDLSTACDEYFQWVDENPLMAADVVKFQGVATIKPVPRMRAMTIVGLCNFLDIGTSTWSDYKAKPEFSDTCKQVEETIYQQKVEGAAAELLNANFIGKEIGLVDKQEVEHGGLPEVNVYLPDNGRDDG